MEVFGPKARAERAVAEHAISIAKRPAPSTGFQLVSLSAGPANTVNLSLDLPPPPDGDVAELVAWEVRQLTRDPSDGLVSIEMCGAPVQYVGDDDDVHFTHGRPPPVEVVAHVNGGEDTEYHSKRGLRVRLVADKRYPRKPPEVHFMQHIFHFFLDHDNGLPSIFYELLGDLALVAQARENSALAQAASDAGGGGIGRGGFMQGQPVYSLRATLCLLQHLLSTPLHPCDSCNEQHAKFARMHAARQGTIRAWSNSGDDSGGDPGAAGLSDPPPEPNGVPAPPISMDSIGMCGACDACDACETPCTNQPELYDCFGWRAEWLHPELRAALGADGDAPLRSLLRECTEGVYAFPMLTDAACAMLVREVDDYNASGLPTSRPNSMNKYGLVLNEIGMEPLFDSMQSRVLQRIAALLWPLEGGSLDRHHSFVVQYETGKDLGLDMHTDNSDVTFNVCLGREFEGAGLTFCGYMGQADHRHFSYRHQHVKGHCIVHLGRRRHGADDLTSGERLNLIIWNTNLAYRHSKSYTDLNQQRKYVSAGTGQDGVARRSGEKASCADGLLGTRVRYEEESVPQHHLPNLAGTRRSRGRRTRSASRTRTTATTSSTRIGPRSTPRWCGAPGALPSLRGTAAPSSRRSSRRRAARRTARCRRCCRTCCPAWRRRRRAAGPRERRWPRT